MKVEREVEIAAPPQDLYEVVMDPSRLEDWVTIHEYLEGAPPRQLREGSKLTQCLKLAGQRFKVRWTVVENEPCQAGRVGGPGTGALHGQGGLRVRAANGDGTTLLLRQRVRPPGRPAWPAWRGRWSAGHGGRARRITEKAQSLVE